MSDPSNLQRSVSHLNWGSYLGFDEAGHYAIETVEGRRLSYDVISGRLVAARWILSFARRSLRSCHRMAAEGAAVGDRVPVAAGGG
jgi:hypothetical protein